MEKAVGYEIRRRIRAQIRVVKRLIAEGKLTTVTTITKLKSVIRDSPKTRRSQSPEKIQTGYQVKFTTKTTPDSIKSDNKLFSHTDIIDKKETSERVSEYQSSYTYDEYNTSDKVTSSTLEEKSNNKTNTSEKGQAKPEWVTQRNLKKVTSNATPVSKLISTNKKNIISSSSSNATKLTDIITSGYGIGPLDENGTPLFGLKALRAQNSTTTGL